MAPTPWALGGNVSRETQGRRMKGAETLEGFGADCEALGLRLSQRQMDQFAAYHSMLLEWNAHVNLVSRGDEARIYRRHFLESVSILGHFQPRMPCRAGDLGSGAGFPGVPLKIVLPELELTLIESKRKKAFFLERLCVELGLDRCLVCRSRAEELAEAAGHRAAYDLVLARAIGSTAQVCGLAGPLLAPGGLLVCYKGPDAVEESGSGPACGLEPSGCISQTGASGRPTVLLLFTKSGAPS